MFVGDLSWRKGAADVLYAAKCFEQDAEVRDMPVRFLFVGARLTAEFRKRAEWLGLGERVIIGNPVGYDRMAQVYRCADIVTVPSVPTPTWYEQGSCVMLESMGTGKVLVVSDSGAMPELLGDAGVRVPAADYFELYKALKDLALSDAKREEYGRRARARACECLDAEITREQTARLFDRLLG